MLNKVMGKMPKAAKKKKKKVTAKQALKNTATEMGKEDCRKTGDCREARHSS